MQLKRLKSSSSSAWGCSPHLLTFLDLQRHVSGWCTSYMQIPYILQMFGMRMALRCHHQMPCLGPYPVLLLNKLNFLIWVHNRLYFSSSHHGMGSLQQGTLGPHVQSCPVISTGSRGGLGAAPALPWGRQETSDSLSWCQGPATHPNSPGYRYFKQTTSQNKILEI